MEKFRTLSQKLTEIMSFKVLSPLNFLPSIPHENLCESLIFRGLSRPGQSLSLVLGKFKLDLVYSL